MGRIIEARVWTGTEMVYLKSSKLAYNHYLTLGEKFFLYSIEGKRLATSTTGGEIMLKTPKKDKKGNAVWEGDIVGVVYQDDEDVDQLDYSAVLWSDELGGFGIDDSFENNGTSFSPLMEFKDLEVVGNIYQQKNLLENEKNPN